MEAVWLSEWSDSVFEHTAGLWNERAITAEEYVIGGGDSLVVRKRLQNTQAQRSEQSAVPVDKATKESFQTVWQGSPANNSRGEVVVGTVAREGRQRIIHAQAGLVRWVSRKRPPIVGNERLEFIARASAESVTVHCEFISTAGATSSGLLPITWPLHFLVAGATSVVA